VPEAATPDLHLDDLDDRERDAVEALLFRLADDELVLAHRYIEWQVKAPTLESDIALANVSQDELGHARLWYQLLQRFEYDEPDLLFEREADDFRHSTLVELPFPEGDWADAIVRSYLYDVAEDVRIHAIEDSSVPAIRDRVGKVLQEEDFHLDHAHSWLDRLADVEEGQERLQAAVDRLYPHALTLFEPVGDVEATIDDLGIRDRSLAELREEWLTRVDGTLAGLGIDVPEAAADESAVPIGRDGEHTEHWQHLHEEMVGTYHDLGRDSTPTIMEADDEQ
jgi:ring-1,2-phenylacetyl-CoA epoxidase subunit PaaC